MNKLRTLIVAAVLAPAMAFAELVPMVYVVPAGTTGNTPTEPYDTWATAANDIRTAAECVETHGIVKVLAGSYSATKGYMPTRAYQMQVFTDATESAFGSISLAGSSICDDHFADADPDHHSIRVTRGTIALTGSAVMLDNKASGNNYRAQANYKLTLCSEYAALTGEAFYLGYWTDGATLRLTEGATASFTSAFYMSEGYGGSHATLIVEDGSSATFGAVCQSTKGTDNTIIVSNATLKASNYNFGADGAEQRMKVIIAGEAPRLRSNSTGNYYGDTKVIFNVAEMPVTGYENYPMYHSGITFSETASISLEGLYELRTRLRQAGTKTLTTSLAIAFGGSASMNIPASVITAANEAMTVSGFTLYVSGAYVYLKFVEPGATIAYVDSKNYGFYPYDTWADAAQTITEAAAGVSKGGIIRIASGTYTGSPVAPEYEATYEAYEEPWISGSAADQPAGTVTFAGSIFSGLAGTNTDPQRHLLTLAKGTFIPSSTVFIDSGSAGYGQDTRNRLVVTGVGTVFGSKSQSMYVGYSAKNTQLTVQNGATCYANTIYSGRGTVHGANSTITVKDDARLELASSLTMGQQATGAKLEVDDATVVCASLDCGQAATTLGERIVLKGRKPYLNPSNAMYVNGNATVEFDVSELDVGAAKTHAEQIFSAIYTMSETTSVAITGLQDLVNRVAADDTAPKTITYHLVYGWNTFTVPEAVLASARSELPEGCTLAVNGKYLDLTIKRDSGMMIIVR